MCVTQVVAGNDACVPEKAVIDDGDRVHDHEAPRLEQSHDEPASPAQRVAEDAGIRFDVAHVGL
jgi:hypothetical protein